MTLEEEFCDLARVTLAWNGYLVIGNQVGWWLFSYWIVKASKEGQVWRAQNRCLSIALHQIMVQLPEFGE